MIHREISLLFFHLFLLILLIYLQILLNNQFSFLLKIFLFQYQNLNYYEICLDFLLLVYILFLF